MSFVPSSDENRRLKFLLDEGLELLATFQLISDTGKRRELFDAVRQAAVAEGACLPRFDNLINRGEGPQPIDEPSRV